MYNTCSCCTLKICLCLYLNYILIELRVLIVSELESIMWSWVQNWLASELSLSVYLHCLVFRNTVGTVLEVTVGC